MRRKIFKTKTMKKALGNKIVKTKTKIANTAQSVDTKKLIRKIKPMTTPIMIPAQKLTTNHEGCKFCLDIFSIRHS